ncbi:hypothetical protein HJC99_01400 [Candidatus Saccharibacteria bacterium]|nr:hypothetical protein [Candidatus Saccharibacteria bacterium]
MHIPVIVTGYETYRFNTWLPGWTAADNLDGAGLDFQSGRPVDVAVPTADLEAMVATGRPVSNNALIAMHIASTGRANRRPFGSPVVAVRINDRWVEPLG